ncbi:MAG TPA: IreB family regulatory phosphoprotein [Firmicutes bacterium]|nr:IreB family regulatory phosphoprotein [Bacillota bacterium]
MRDEERTRLFSTVDGEVLNNRDTLTLVHQALQEKGYNPLDQIIGFLVSGDPSYITTHKNARQLIQRTERNDLLEEIVAYYLANL